MVNILESSFMLEFGMLTDKLYANGWHERNSGNISVLLEPSFVQKYLDINHMTKIINLEIEVKALAGKYLLVTGSGKYLKKY